MGSGWRRLGEEQVLLHCYHKKEELRVRSRVGLAGFRSFLADSLGELLDLSESLFPHGQNMTAGTFNM